jgi:protoporphyrinogen/coproporphyrinogen III oxidase
MTRIAILGGGIAGLAAAYELEKARQKNPEIDWHLYESTNRLGGIVETTQQDGYILEQGPDGWVTEKPWARDLAIELGLEDQLISSNDAIRKTYILIDGVLQPIPDRMRMMVPEDLSTLAQSPLFSDTAREVYASELTRAEELKASASTEDESVASFVRRHFGEEVLTKIAAPLLSGVFGGDVHKLSVHSVMPNFVTMEQKHGSLIAALQAKAKARGDRPQQPIFTTLRNGLGTLIHALIAKLPEDRLHLNHPAHSLKREGKRWCLRTTPPGEKGRLGKSKKHFNHIFLATPIDITRQLLHPLDPTAATLIPTEASSAILAAFAFPNATFTLPPGFGFLVPANPDAGAPDLSPLEIGVSTEPQLLAATFVTQKFPHRAPAGAQILRAFFGGPSAETLAPADDKTIAQTALTQLQKVLGPLPIPTITTIRRWPRSLPQYEVGHQTRIAQLDQHIAALGNLTLLGNAYHGVGLPDLIRDARAAVQSLIKA